VAFIQEFGCYLPEHIATNEEIAALAGCTPEWIVNVSGIIERRFARPDETVADMAVLAAEDCLSRAGLTPSDLGLILVSSGSSERRFPGPAAQVARRMGLDSTPAIDVPMASAGSLFAMSLADRLAQDFGNVLVVAAEKMSTIALSHPVERGISILFGDGAGSCLISRDRGIASIEGSSLHSDGSFADDLTLPLDGCLSMNGRSVIMQVTRKLPRALREVVEANGHSPIEVEVFLLHQANSNVITRVAQSLEVPADRFYSNIARYGNTSSASMLIAAAEWSRQHGFTPGLRAAFGGFGAGFHWGALLAVGVR
jgi:3-oxoacyl-[acyl-carrier-protein] synthase-3